jgi:hypothetical protein
MDITKIEEKRRMTLTCEERRSLQNDERHLRRMEINK